MSVRVTLWVLFLNILAGLSAGKSVPFHFLLNTNCHCATAQTDLTCGRANNANSTLIITNPSNFTAALTDTTGPCTNYTGSLDIIPPTNYDLMDYGGLEGYVKGIDGSIIINCTGVSTNAVIEEFPFYAAFSSVISLTGSFALLGCSTISILDFYSVTTIGGDLTITVNQDLSSSLVYSLKHVGGSIKFEMDTIPSQVLQDKNPVQFELNDLETVGGDINITGPLTTLTNDPGKMYVLFFFSNKRTLTPKFNRAPNLTMVKGSVFINSTGMLDCTQWNKLNSSGVIQGSYFCDSPLMASGGPGVHLSHGAIAGIVVGCIIGTMAAIIAIVIIVLKNKSPINGPESKLEPSKSSMDAGTSPAELLGKKVGSELPGKIMPWELPGHEGIPAELSGRENIGPPAELSSSGVTNNPTLVRWSDVVVPPAELPNSGVVNNSTEVRWSDVVSPPAELPNSHAIDPPTLVRWSDVVVPPTELAARDAVVSPAELSGGNVQVELPPEGTSQGWHLPGGTIQGSDGREAGGEGQTTILNSQQHDRNGRERVPVVQGIPVSSGHDQHGVTPTLTEDPD
jgi:hypothetical protein